MNKLILSIFLVFSSLQIAEMPAQELTENKMTWVLVNPFTRQPLQVLVNQEFQFLINLGDNNTGLFELCNKQWSVLEWDESFEYIKYDFITEPFIVGSDGIQQWVLKATEPGIHRITFKRGDEIKTLVVIVKTRAPSWILS